MVRASWVRCRSRLERRRRQISLHGPARSAAPAERSTAPRRSIASTSSVLSQVARFGREPDTALVGRLCFSFSEEANTIEASRATTVTPVRSRPATINHENPSGRAPSSAHSARASPKGCSYSAFPRVPICHAILKQNSTRSQQSRTGDSGKPLGFKIPTEKLDEALKDIANTLECLSQGHP